MLETSAADGRRAILTGTGWELWQVIDALDRGEDLGLGAAQLRLAEDVYARAPEEIDRAIAAHRGRSGRP